MPRGVRAGLAALVLAALAPVSPAAGQDAGVGAGDPLARSQAVEQELGRLADQFEEGSLEEARVVAEYQVSQRRQAALTAEVAKLDLALTENQAALEAAEATTASATAVATAAATRVREATRRVDDARDHVRTVALLSYVGQGPLDLAADALDDAVDAVDLGIGLTYARAVGDEQGRRVARLQADEAERRRLEGEAATARHQAEVAQAGLQQSRSRLDADRSARAKALAAAAAEAASQARMVEGVRAAQAQVRGRMGELQQESAAIVGLLRARAAPAPVQAPRAAPAPPPATAPAAARPSATPATAAARAATTAPRPAAPPAATRPAPPTTAARPTAPGPTRAPSPTVTPTPTPATTAAGTTAPKASARPGGAVGAAPPVTVSLTWPLPGWPLVSGFGMRTQPILGVNRLHEGIDIWAPAGTPILAAGDGVVLWAGPRSGYGTAVILDHGGGLGTVYAHQSAVAVSPGQRVTRGQVIGYVGQTGLAAGPHLHFEVRVNGTPYDPLHFVHAG